MKWMRWMLVVLVCFTYRLSAQDCSFIADTPNPCMCQPDSTQACNGCGDCNAPWQVEQASFFIYGTDPETGEADSCIVDVQYRIRQCRPPNPGVQACCELEFDWLWPQCHMCRNQRWVFTHIQFVIGKYFTGNLCWTYNSDGFNLVSRRPKCWRETNVPPPGVTPPPQGFSPNEVWLVPCTSPPCCLTVEFTNQNGRICPVVDNQHQCYYYAPRDFNCLAPNYECNVDVCCPPRQQQP